MSAPADPPAVPPPPAGQQPGGNAVPPAAPLPPVVEQAVATLPPAMQPAATTVAQTTQTAAHTVTDATKQAQAAVQQVAQQATVSPRKALYRGRRFIVIYALLVAALAFLLAPLGRDLPELLDEAGDLARFAEGAHLHGGELGGRGRGGRRPEPFR